jgi:glycerophosphoryl diester phosphodiesterase
MLRNKEGSMQMSFSSSPSPADQGWRPYPAAQKPTITAHAGSLGTKPNSPESFLAAMALPVDYLEADVRFTREGRAYLSHDALDAEAQARAMSLEELLGSASRKAGLRLNLDLKEYSGIGPMRELLERFGMAARVVLTGVRLESVPAVRAAAGGLPYFLNAGPGLFERLTRSAAAGLARRIRDCGAVGLNTHHSRVSRAVALALAEAGLALSVWTVDDGPTMLRIMGLEPDNITTRLPDRLLALRDSPVGRARRGRGAE